MDKLASFVGDNDTITGEDVEKVVGRALFSSAFDLVWAVGSGRTKAAVNMVSDLVSSGRKPHEIIGILCWHLRRVLKARMLKAGGSSDSNVVHDAGISEIYFDEFIRQVRHFDIPNIKSMMEVLLEADCDIKRTKFDPAIILDFAIMRLCLGRG
jgi:DNA polymerase III delta subunit